MLEYLKLYCDNRGYIIKQNKIFSEDNVIGHIDYENAYVQLGNNKLKYGDFALLLIENVDILGETK